MIEEIKKEIENRIKDKTETAVCQHDIDIAIGLQISLLILDKYKEDTTTVTTTNNYLQTNIKVYYQKDVDELLKYKNAFEELYLHYGVIPMDSVSLAFIINKIAKKYEIEVK